MRKGHRCVTDASQRIEKTVGKNGFLTIPIIYLEAIKVGRGDSIWIERVDAHTLGLSASFPRAHEHVTGAVVSDTLSIHLPKVVQTKWGFAPGVPVSMVVQGTSLIITRQ